jgi:cytochrome b subunit of formate dehydrogenase
MKALFKLLIIMRFSVIAFDDIFLSFYNQIHLLRKCFTWQAPALIFYNNKTFTKDDWRGIRSIYTSVKRDDPLKIGRFGLGFKSVFHLTGILKQFFNQNISSNVCTIILFFLVTLNIL